MSITAFQGHEVGGFVTLGADTNQKMSWQVLAFRRASAEKVYATVRSGGAGITRVVDATILRPWAPKKKGA